jgi:hypothetical protein
MVDRHRRPRAPSGPRLAWRVSVLLLVLFAPFAATAGGMPFGQGLLWRIERDGTPASHVFGTMHLSDPRVTALPEPVASALRAARRLALELVPTHDTPVQIARAMMLSDGHTLDEIVGAELFDRAAAAGQVYGVPAPTVRRLKPWAVMTAISMPREESERRRAGKLALDNELLARARASGIPVVALERIDEQLGVFDSFDESDQVALLRQALDMQPEMPTQVERMVAFYLARDTGRLLEWVAARSAGEDARLRKRFEDKLLTARNRTFATRAEPLLAEGGLFVAVGAGHLPGRDGLLALLTARGWRATRVY